MLEEFNVYAVSYSVFFIINLDFFSLVVLDVSGWLFAYKGIPGGLQTLDFSINILVLLRPALDDTVKTSENSKHQQY